MEAPAALELGLSERPWFATVHADEPNVDLPRTIVYREATTAPEVAASVAASLGCPADHA
jgi:hypothetical protein